MLQLSRTYKLFDLVALHPNFREPQLVSFVGRHSATYSIHGVQRMAWVFEQDDSLSLAAVDLVDFGSY